ncbi:MAG: Arsenical pump rane protein [Herminiimonas sp.]|nr:Arsenical pump rane protein [Herminiimonas sp.]
MNAALSYPIITCLIAAASTLGIIVRPFKVPEAVWALLGAFALCALGLLSWTDALHAAGNGTEVYLFLTGMMIASELARKEGLFDFLAALAVRRAAGSARRLFLLVYGVGIVVTVFMSNDATAVVLTPAVFAAAKAAKADDPLPYLYICAFVANAASFVLPISNPANLVIFQDRMPTLLVWLSHFALPSVLSIGATCIALRIAQRRALMRPIAQHIDVPPLSPSGKMAGYGIALMALVLLAVSGLDMALGWPTFLAGVGTLAAVCLRKRTAPWPHLTEISWGVLPLVAGLFVLVEGLQRTGLLAELARALHDGARYAPGLTVWLAGIGVALGSNLINNLPAGLIAGSTASAAHASGQITSAILIGVDIGPNLSVTGSLATILWLAALRREGQKVSAWAFLKLGCVVMLPALLLALGAVFVTH